jgi:hypothetical protein
MKIYLLLNYNTIQKISNKYNHIIVRTTSSSGTVNDVVSIDVGVPINHDTWPPAPCWKRWGDQKSKGNSSILETREDNLLQQSLTSNRYIQGQLYNNMDYESLSFVEAV